MEFMKYRYSFLAGACSAGGSFFGKLPSLLDSGQLFIFTNNTICAMFHIISLFLMICCNICNWNFFLKGLQLSEHTIITTLLTATSNYMLTESLTFLSSVGVLLILVGLWTLCDKNEFNQIKGSKQL